MWQFTADKTSMPSSTSLVHLTPPIKIKDISKFQIDNHMDSVSLSSKQTTPNTIKSNQQSSPKTVNKARFNTLRLKVNSWALHKRQASIWPSLLPILGIKTLLISQKCYKNWPKLTSTNIGKFLPVLKACQISHLNTLRRMSSGSNTAVMVWESLTGMFIFGEML